MTVDVGVLDMDDQVCSKSAFYVFEFFYLIVWGMLPFQLWFCNVNVSSSTG